MKNLSQKEKNFIKNAPKAELHIHLEGTISPDFLFKMAERNQIKLPFSKPEDVLKTQQSSKSGSTENLKNFLKCLNISREAMRSAEDYYDISSEMLKNLHRENVVYAEIFFDPQQGMRQGIPFEKMVDALKKSKERAKTTYGLETKWIMCFQRDYPSSEAIALLELASSHLDFIVGIGLDNDEVDGFTEDFAEAFKLAKSMGLKLTSHCDVNQTESYTNIKGCLYGLNVDRIDHGLNVADYPDLLEVVRSKKIGLTGVASYYLSEVSVHYDRIDMFKKLLENDVLISINSDDPTQFGSGWINQCLYSMQSHGDFTSLEMLKFLENAFLSSWLDESQSSQYLNQLRTYAKKEGVLE